MKARTNVITFVIMRRNFYPILNDHIKLQKEFMLKMFEQMRFFKRWDTRKVHKFPNTCETRFFNPGDIIYDQNAPS